MPWEPSGLGLAQRQSRSPGGSDGREGVGRSWAFREALVARIRHGEAVRSSASSPPGLGGPLSPSVSPGRTADP